MRKVKRIYQLPSKEDGYRVLVDRLWPRGLSKQKARVDLWLRDVAPSHQLRKWYAHDPKKWPEFKRRYAQELSRRRALVEKIRQIEKQEGKITLLFGSKEEERNNAVALDEILRCSQG